jgi:hypothetical protein
MMEKEKEEEKGHLRDFYDVIVMHRLSAMLQ